MADEYIQRYMREVKQVTDQIHESDIRAMVDVLVNVRQTGGRLFFLGVGGGAAHASHAVNDFRKIAGIECYSPCDNVAELTARINDEGWDSCYAEWLRGSRIGPKDAVFVFSVGGGNLEKNVSANIVNALRVAKDSGARVLGVVGRDGGYTAQVADACVVVPTIQPDTVTAHAEAFQAVVWHLLVSHPEVKLQEMKWESVR
jgi:D-sedoheptulose 7-phosphate isomerase